LLLSAGRGGGIGGTVCGAGRVSMKEVVARMDFGRCWWYMTVMECKYVEAGG